MNEVKKIKDKDNSNYFEDEEEGPRRASETPYMHSRPRRRSMRRVRVEDESDDEQEEAQDLYIDEEPIRREGRDSVFRKVPNQINLCWLSMVFQIQAKSVGKHKLWIPFSSFSKRWTSSNSTIAIRFLSSSPHLS
jgi:hypothetical protein